MMTHPLMRGPGTMRGRAELPQNRRLPALYRLLADVDEPAAPGELGRDPRLALVEAALLAADEPLTPRKLSAAAGRSAIARPRRTARRPRTAPGETVSPSSRLPAASAVIGLKARKMVTFVAAACFSAHSQRK